MTNQDDPKKHVHLCGRGWPTQVPSAVMALAIAFAMFALLSIVAGAVNNEDRGKEIFERRCTGCHSLDSDKEGPRLRGVYGRISGRVPTFTYSDSVKNAHITWDAASLDKWLTDPDALIPGNDMGFRVSKPDERAAIIDYLKQVAKQGGSSSEPERR